MKIIVVAIVIVVTIITIFAVVSEAREYKLLKGRKPLCQIQDPERRQLELEYYSCYNFESRTYWRMFFITSLIFAIIVQALVYYTIGVKIPAYVLLILGFIFFSIQTIMNNYRTYHYDKDMCMKVRNNMLINEYTETTCI